MHKIILILPLPSKKFLKSNVSLESRYGTILNETCIQLIFYFVHEDFEKKKSLAFFAPLKMFSRNVSMQFLSAINDELMLPLIGNKFNFLWLLLRKVRKELTGFFQATARVLSSFTAFTARQINKRQLTYVYALFGLRMGKLIRSTSNTIGPIRSISLRLIGNRRYRKQPERYEW